MSDPEPCRSFRERWPPLLTTILAGFLLYGFVAMWPLVPVEGDDAAIALGVRLLDDPAADRELIYRYSAQPGTYRVVAWLSRSVASQPLETLLLLTAMAALALILLTGELIGSLLRIPAAAGALVVFLVPEFLMAGSFGNSSVPAAACAVGAMVLLIRRPRTSSAVLAGGLAALAVWMRFDAVLAMPAASILAVRGTGRPMVRLTVFLASTAVAAGILYGAGGASLTEVFGAYSSHSRSFTNPWGAAGRVLSTTLPAGTVFLALIGIGRWITDREWPTLAMLAAGIAPTALAYGPFLSSPKYLLHALPWVALAACAGVLEIFRRRRHGLLIFTTALVGAQYLLDPFSMLPGDAVVRTNDGIRRRGCIAAAPVDAHRFKQRVLEEQDRLRASLFDSRPAVPPRIITDRWRHSRMFLLMASRQGFEISSARSISGFRRHELSRGSVRTTLYARYSPLWRWRRARRALEELELNDRDRLVFIGDRRSLELFGDATSVRRISSSPLGSWRIVIRDPNVAGL